MKKTRQELAAALLGCDLLTIPFEELGPLCQAFGKGGKGTREELVERLARALQEEYTDMSWPVTRKTWKEINS